MHAPWLNNNIGYDIEYDINTVPRVQADLATKGQIQQQNPHAVTAHVFSIVLIDIRVIKNVRHNRWLSRLRLCLNPPMAGDLATVSKLSPLFCWK